MSKENTAPSEERQKGKWIIRGAVLLIIILLVFLGLYKCRGENSPDEVDTNVIIGAGVKKGEIKKEAESDKAKVNSNGKSEMTVRMNGYPVFADGESKGSLNIENPTVNELYMNVETTLTSTGEVIYDSGAIPPGHYIDNDTLTKVLKKGTYEATAHVTLFDPEYPDSNYNSANFKLVITIAN